MGCNGTCARAHTHTHGLRISGTVGPIAVVFWFVVREPTVIGLFTKYGTWTVFHVRTCTPLFCISGTTSAIMSKFRIGIIELEVG